MQHNNYVITLQSGAAIWHFAATLALDLLPPLPERERFLIVGSLPPGADF